MAKNTFKFMVKSKNRTPKENLDFITLAQMEGKKIKESPSQLLGSMKKPSLIEDLAKAILMSSQAMNQPYVPYATPLSAIARGYLSAKQSQEPKFEEYPLKAVSPKLAEAFPEFSNFPISQAVPLIKSVGGTLYQKPKDIITEEQLPAVEKLLEGIVENPKEDAKDWIGQNRDNLELYLENRIKRKKNWGNKEINTIRGLSSLIRETEKMMDNFDISEQEREQYRDINQKAIKHLSKIFGIIPKKVEITKPQEEEIQEGKNIFDKAIDFLKSIYRPFSQSETQKATEENPLELNL